MLLYMKQKAFSWVDRFTIWEENGDARYFVKGEFLSWGKKLHVYNTQEEEVAFIRQKMLAWLPRYIIEADGREVCHIQKKFAFLSQQYALEGLPWHVEGDFWAHEYTMFDDNHEIMRLSKHWFTLGDSYELNISNDQDDLLCLCVALAIDAAMAQNTTVNTASN